MSKSKIKQENEKVPSDFFGFFCFQWMPSFKEGGEYPLSWGLVHILKPKRPQSWLYMLHNK